MNKQPAFPLSFFSAFFFLLLSSVAPSVSQSQYENEFNYDEGSGRGQSRWGLLKTQWGNCSIGRRQSPIDISTVQQLGPQSGDLKKNYTSASAVLKNKTIEVALEFTEDAGKISINGTVYRVRNLHWHSPAEHTFNGTRGDLELHIVHGNGQNQIAVIGLVYRLGRSDPFLKTLLPFIKLLNRGSQNVSVRAVNPADSIGNLNNKKYFRYNGSLTTPPCTEGVVWTVLQQVKSVSMLQLDALTRVLPPQNRNNSRPTQPLNGRTVLKYDPPKGKRTICT